MWARLAYRSAIRPAELDSSDKFRGLLNTHLALGYSQASFSPAQNKSGRIVELSLQCRFLPAPGLDLMKSLASWVKVAWARFTAPATCACTAVALHWKRRFWDCPSIYCTGIVEA